MDRGSTAAFQAEIVKGQNRPVHLVSIHLDNETSYMTDAYKTITYGGNDYAGVGHFLGFSDIEESAEISVTSVTVNLSGIDQSWVSNFLNQDYIDREIKVSLAFIDDAQALVVDPVLIFDGRMNSPVISENPESGESTISITATNSWVDFERTTGRYTNHEAQQIHFSGDKGFEFASKITEDITWGKK